MNKKLIGSYAYVAICIFDFMIVPMWFGITRPHFSEVVASMPEGDLTLQMEYLRILTDHHDPYTLQKGGMFHLAYGAWLTGTAITKEEKNEQS